MQDIAVNCHRDFYHTNFHIPEGKRIVFINTPFTFVFAPLCPLGILSVNILKLISLLKSRGNTVDFIDMCAENSFLWKTKKAGLEGTAHMDMMVMGKPYRYLLNRLESLPADPDEIWISCIFTFDYDLVGQIVGLCRKLFKRAKIIVGGDFVRNAPAIAQLLNVDIYRDRIPEADIAIPDFSVKDDWHYGIFQLEIGCPNKCGFCLAGNDKPHALSVETVIDYMKDFYDKHSPSTFWNWDPNVLAFSDLMDEFLTKYAHSGMKSNIVFGKGFQPNRLSERLIRKMAETTQISASLPIEAADSQTIIRHKKPYNIISTIKLLTIAKKYKFNLKNSQCTYIIGYPDDNIAAIFRAFLTVIILGGASTPFPVFLFPGSLDYKKYYDLIKHKDLYELHGQLWPLIPSKDVMKYHNLLIFLHQKSLQDAEDNMHLLTPEFAEIYKRELYLIDDFIELCQKAPKDTIHELISIEEKLGQKNARYHIDKEIEKIVYITANPKSPDRSISQQLGKYFFDEYLKLHSNVDIQHIDLFKENIRFINEEFIDVIFKSPGDISQETQRLIEQADRYIKMLRQADKVVISCPMWTFSIPSILKAFFELVSSRLFYYHNKLIPTKPVLCILTRDGVYLPGSVVQKHLGQNVQINLQEISIIAALEFMGMGKNIRFIRAENLFMPKNRSASIEKARLELAKVAKEF